MGKSGRKCRTVVRVIFQTEVITAWKPKWGEISMGMSRNQKINILNHCNSTYILS